MGLYQYFILLCNCLEFCLGTIPHINFDEAFDVPQFVAVKVHQQHGGASPDGAELNDGSALQFGAHSSNPAKKT